MLQGYTVTWLQQRLQSMSNVRGGYEVLNRATSCNCHMLKKEILIILRIQKAKCSANG